MSRFMKLGIKVTAAPSLHLGINPENHCTSAFYLHFTSTSCIFIYMFSSQPEQLVESQGSAYSHGVSLTTVRQDVDVGPRSRGVLALPHPGSDGACNFFSPVRFLVDQQASCTSTLLPDSCSALSRFSGRIYAVSSEISGCSQSFKVGL